MIQGAQLSNSFITLMALNKANKPLNTTQISEIISLHTKWAIYKVSGALKDSLENRLRKAGYVDGRDIPNEKTDRKPRLCSLNVKPIAKGILSLLCYSKEIGHLQSIFTMHYYIYTFQDFHSEEHQGRYFHL
jgi:hypothetical protein